MPTTESADNDQLFVLTAVLLTPAQFPSVLGDDYPEVCAGLGLEPYAEGYGLVLGQDGDGARWTVVDGRCVAGRRARSRPGTAAWSTTSPPASAASSARCPAGRSRSPSRRRACRSRTIRSREEGDPAPLTPPDAEEWGPAQRRLGADEIAMQWAAWREQIDDDDSFAEPGGSGAQGRAAGAGGGARLCERAAAAGAGAVVVRGRRGADAAGGRAWLELVARTDDIAFVLLDDEPGEVHPVGRGPELPGLLSSLDELAARPV